MLPRIIHLNPVYTVNILSTTRQKILARAQQFLGAARVIFSVNGTDFLKFGTRSWKFSRAVPKILQRKRRVDMRGL